MRHKYKTFEVFLCRCKSDTACFGCKLSRRVVSIDATGPLGAAWLVANPFTGRRKGVRVIVRECGAYSVYHSYRADEV